MRRARLVVIVVGILLPYLARIPGAPITGSSWFRWGPSRHRVHRCPSGAVPGGILLASFTFRHPSTLWFPAALGFGAVAIGHAFLDLSSSSTAALGLVAIPLLSLPLVLIGRLAVGQVVQLGGLRRNFRGTM